MKKILFLCHGNICRSPMAEYVCKDLAQGMDVHIESMAVSREEIGNGIYPPAARTLEAHGIPYGKHRARQITRADYDEFDYVIVMERYNLPRLMHIIGQDDEQKVSRLLDFTDTPGDIEDPWYSGNFEMVYQQIVKGCKALIKHIQQGDMYDN